MRLNKNITKLSQMRDVDDDDYVEASPQDLFALVWDITVELWSLSKEGKVSVKSRLQRNVANLTQKRC